MRRLCLPLVAIVALAGVVRPGAAEDAIPPCAARIESPGIGLLLQVRDAGASPETIEETAAVVAERAAALSPMAAPSASTATATSSSPSQTSRTRPWRSRP